MRGIKVLLGICVIATLLLSADSALALINNGWDTACVYAANQKLVDVEEWAESGTGFTGWVVYNAPWSLTFSGTGTNDANLYTIKPNPLWSVGTPKDITIERLNHGTMAVDLTAELGDLLGVTDLASDVSPGQIRYSSYHNSLFVSWYAYGGGQPVQINEIDLGLTQVLNTYQGPVQNSGNSSIALDPEDGTLYVFLQDSQDIVAIDTSSGSTNSYTKVIDHTTYSDSDYGDLFSISYRGRVGPSGKETLVAWKNLPGNASEFDLNAKDVNGNLIKVKAHAQTIDRPSGQLDLKTKQIWLGCGQSIAWSGIWSLDTSDTMAQLGGTAFKNSKWYDAASPAPEPVTLALLGLGLLGLRRRRA